MYDFSPEQPKTPDTPANIVAEKILGRLSELITGIEHSQIHTLRRTFGNANMVKIELNATSDDTYNKFIWPNIKERAQEEFITIRQENAEAIDLDIEFIDEDYAFIVTSKS